jgi:hypothetical protein
MAISYEGADPRPPGVILLLHIAVHNENNIVKIESLTETKRHDDAAQNASDCLAGIAYPPSRLADAG